ncbi:MAG: hypothetical protein AAB935_01800 [Patescibacteria group bacterium]
MKNKLKIINAFVLSAVVTILFIVAMTMLAEIRPIIKDWLKITFSHHWTGKGILAVGLFLALSLLISFLPQETKEGAVRKNLFLLFLVSVAGTLVILGLYILETFRFI